MSAKTPDLRKRFDACCARAKSLSHFYAQPLEVHMTRQRDNGRVSFVIIGGAISGGVLPTWKRLGVSTRVVRFYWKGTYLQ